MMKAKSPWECGFQLQQEVATYLTTHRSCLPYSNIDFKLASLEDGFTGEGGDFVLSEFGVGANFCNNSGVSFVVWSGKNNLHGTTKANITAGYTLLGTSVQISKYLVNKVRLHEEYAKMGKRTHVIADKQYVKKRLDAMNPERWTV